MRRISHIIALILLLTILAWMGATVAHVQRDEHTGDDASAYDIEGRDLSNPDPCRTFITVEHVLPDYAELAAQNQKSPR